MGFSHWAAGVMAVCTIALTGPALADPLRVDAHAMPLVRRIDPRFQSYNVEMAEVIGGRFWKPYAHMSATSTPSRPSSSGGAVALSADLFEARPPLDLSNRRLRVLASALGPAYVRVSGSWANTFYFQDDDNAPLAAPPAGYQGVLTRAQWRGVLGFTRAVNARLVTSFAINAAVRDASGAWTPAQARPLVNYTRSIGGEIYAAEPFNEPNLASHAGGPQDYDGRAFARDVAIFRNFASTAAPNMKIIGPGDSPGITAPAEFVNSEPQPRFDVFEYHYYPAMSQRCAPPDSPIMGVTPQRAMSDEYLAIADQSFAAHKRLRDQYAPNAPIWITETAGAACGGAPWNATFLDSFRYLDQMGRLAKQGVDAIFHNTLAASEYGLIDDATLTPRPNYWAALLWRRLMGTGVLDAGAIEPGFHVYAHCLANHPGGVTLLAINLSDTPRVVAVQSKSALYLLSASELQSSTVMLNGATLSLGAHDTLPPLRPSRANAGDVTIPSHAIAFIALAGARNSNCR